MAFLTSEQLQFFREKGYVVAKNVVPKTLLEPVIDAIFWFLEMDRNDPSTWYTGTPRGGGMVHMHQHQSLWDTRQHPAVHDVFTDIYGTEKLWVSLDRAGMKPPFHPDHPEYDDKGFVHWDMDTREIGTAAWWVQGVLALTDTAAGQGGFVCIPGFHGEYLKRWIATQPEDRNPHAPDLANLPEGFAVTEIPLEAGDLLVWDQTLAHGNGRNTSDKPRLCQYITMFPQGGGDWEDENHAERIAGWREHRPTKGWPGEPREWERKFGTTAHLTPLGRKLLGLDPWEV